MFTPAPNAQHASDWGFTVDEVRGPPLDIWPDNQDAVGLFVSIRTQWRFAEWGRAGLDYNVLYKKMDRLQLTEERYAQLESEVGVMEDAVLEFLAKA